MIGEGAFCGSFLYEVYPRVSPYDGHLRYLAFGYWFLQVLGCKTDACRWVLAARSAGAPLAPCDRAPGEGGGSIPRDLRGLCAAARSGRAVRRPWRFSCKKIHYLQPEKDV